MAIVISQIVNKQFRFVVEKSQVVFLCDTDSVSQRGDDSFFFQTIKATLFSMPQNDAKCIVDTLIKSLHFPVLLYELFDAGKLISVMKWQR